MRRQLTQVYVCPYLVETDEKNKHKTCTLESDAKHINMYRTTKQFTDHLAANHAKEFEDRLVERHGVDGQGKGQKAKVAREDDITPLT